MDKLWNVGGPFMWGALGPGLLDLMVRMALAQSPVLGGGWEAK